MKCFLNENHFNSTKNFMVYKFKRRIEQRTGKISNSGHSKVGGGAEE